MSKWAVIDLAPLCFHQDGQPDTTRTPAVAGLVLGAYEMYEEAFDASSQAWDRSGMQDLRIVSLEAVAPDSSHGAIQIDVQYAIAQLERAGRYMDAAENRHVCNRLAADCIRRALDGLERVREAVTESATVEGSSDE